MIIDCRLIGLSAPRSGTMQLLDSDKETFWAPFEMSDDRYSALFKWAKDEDEFWKTPLIAKVECERLSEDGIPIGNQKIIEVREWDLLYKTWDHEYLNRK